MAKALVCLILTAMVCVAYSRNADRAARQADCNTPCTMDFRPVCGTNGVTYVNLCELERAACLAAATAETSDDFAYDHDGIC